jgi:hypothetical protein
VSKLRRERVGYIYIRNLTKRYSVMARDPLDMNFIEWNYKLNAVDLYRECPGPDVLRITIFPEF